jgi:hypothetical protein
MSDDRANIAVPRDAYAAMADAMRRAVIDRGASKATRKAAFSALLALVDAGLIRDTSAIRQRKTQVAPAEAHTQTRLRFHGLTFPTRRPLVSNTR